MRELVVDHNSNEKWSDGISFSNALTTWTNDANLLLVSESIGMSYP